MLHTVTVVSEVGQPRTEFARDVGGLLDTEEHLCLEAYRARAELELQHAKREVEHLHLIVRLLGIQG
jgi:hypothetical protein